MKTWLIVFTVCLVLGLVAENEYQAIVIQNQQQTIRLLMDAPTVTEN